MTTTKKATAPVLLTTDQVAQQLQVPPSLLTTLRGRKQGPPYIKVGALVRYHPVTLARWVYEQERASQAPVAHVMVKEARNHG